MYIAFMSSLRELVKVQSQSSMQQMYKSAWNSTITIKFAAKESSVIMSDNKIW